MVLYTLNINVNSISRINPLIDGIKLFNEFYERVKNIWKMEKLFKGHDIKKLKKEKKYEYILKDNDKS